jgi:hypothetical protein
MTNLISLAQPLLEDPENNRADISRRHARRMTRANAILYTRSVFQSVSVVDFSSGGLGLAGTAGLFPGDKVTVALTTGEKKSGVVRWWLSGACGVQFDAVSEEDDPFLVKLQKKANAMAS